MDSGPVALTTRSPGSRRNHVKDPIVHSGTVTFALFTDPAGKMVGLVEAETPAAAE